MDGPARGNGHRKLKKTCGGKSYRGSNKSGFV